MECAHFKATRLLLLIEKFADDYKIAVIAENIKKMDLRDIYISPKMREVLDSFE